jgi:hypothetical protein
MSVAIVCLNMWQTPRFSILLRRTIPRTRSVRADGVKGSPMRVTKRASTVPETTNSGLTVSRYLPTHASARWPMGMMRSRSPLPCRIRTVYLQTPSLSTCQDM